MMTHNVIQKEEEKEFPRFWEINTSFQVQTYR